MDRPSLVILAAGLGRRYGGAKQLAVVGPGGTTLIDYGIYDALRAGFGRVVLVVSAESEGELRAALGNRLADRVELAWVHQRLDQLPAAVPVPADRRKPWGTGHAVLATEPEVAGPFAVINADDFYGRGAYRLLADHLRGRCSSDATWALVAYPLRHTLSPRGPVSRGVCAVSARGRLERIVETAGLEAAGDGGTYPAPSGELRHLDGATPISMNLWGFTPALFPQLREAFGAFLADHLSDGEAELHLPAVVQRSLEAGRARVDVLCSPDRWLGLTHADDQAAVVAAIAALTEQGVYPEQLWEGR